MFILLFGTAAENPQLQLSEVFSPLGVDLLNEAWNTQPVHHLNDTIARLFRLKGAIMQIKPGVMPAWQAAISAESAAQNNPVCQVFVCMDTFDGGTVVPVAWQTD